MSTLTMILVLTFMILSFRADILDEGKNIRVEFELPGKCRGSIKRRQIDATLFIFFIYLGVPNQNYNKISFIFYVANIMLIITLFSTLFLFSPPQNKLPCPIKSRISPSSHHNVNVMSFYAWCGWCGWFRTFTSAKSQRTDR